MLYTRYTEPEAGTLVECLYIRRFGGSVRGSLCSASPEGKTIVEGIWLANYRF